MFMTVLVALLFLTFVTVAVAQFDFGSANMLIAMAIAAVKASLVIAFFMHVKWDTAINKIVFLSSFLFLSLLFVFTLAAGIAVLFAAVQSTIDERRFESAMLRALGARRRTVFAGVMAEFAALGAAAGVLASAGASILAALVATRLFELPYAFNPLIWIAGVGAGILVVCVSGVFAARGAVNAVPVEVLRGLPG